MVIVGTVILLSLIIISKLYFSVEQQKIIIIIDLYLAITIKNTLLTQQTIIIIIQSFITKNVLSCSIFVNTFNKSS